MKRVMKAQLLARIRADRASFDQALAVAPYDRLTDPVAQPEALMRVRLRGWR